MSGTYTNLLTHIIFSTKNREKLINPKFAPELYSYLGGIIKNEKGKLISAGGTTNHIHLLALLSPAIATSEMLRKVKGNSSKWINIENKLPQKFSWQKGYGAFAVSESQKNKIIKYITIQDEHHRARTFKEEFINFLKRHNVTYDEKYIWD